MDGLSATPPIVAIPEPGACGWRVNSDADLPPWLAGRIDWHVRPSASPWQAGPMARVSCTHVDWEAVWTRDPDLFDRRQQLGIPDPTALWYARQVLVEHGHELILEVQLEYVDDQLAIAIYGAGVLGILDDRPWAAVAPLLTTCVSTLREPDPEFLMTLARDPVAPSLGSPRPHAGRRIADGIAPQEWLRGSWMHTWWSYPAAGRLRATCVCPAHRPEITNVRFGPTAESA